MERQGSSNVYDSYQKLKKEFSRFEMLTEEQEADLSKRIKEGDKEAHQKLVNSHLRFLLKCAKYRAYLGVELQDLVMAGYEGLDRAARTFDSEKGRFSQYASWWIWHYMQRSVCYEWNTIKTTVEVETKLQIFNSIASETKALSNQTAIEAQIREQTGITSDRKMERLMKAWQLQVTSLDKPINGHGDSDRFLKDIIPDNSAEDQESETVRNEIIDEIAKILDTLNPRYRFVMEQHYGLNGGKEHTFQEIGEMLGVTKQRAKQIEQTTRKEIRAAINKKLLQQVPEARLDFQQKDSIKKAS